jgi:hypothetical protein
VADPYYGGGGGGGVWGGGGWWVGIQLYAIIICKSTDTLTACFLMCYNIIMSQLISYSMFLDEVVDRDEIPANVIGRQLVLHLSNPRLNVLHFSQELLLLPRLLKFTTFVSRSEID